jgi:hypothetical protein
MNLLSKAKRVAVFAALTLTLTLSSASLPRGGGVFKCEPGSASAASHRLRVVWYYSDATYTTHVGTGKFYCNGTAGLTGRSTPYRIEVLNEPCCGNLPC